MKRMYLALLLGLLLSACGRDENVTPATPPPAAPRTARGELLRPVTVKFHKGSIPALDSAWISLSKPGQTYRKRLTPRGDTLEASFSGISGTWQVAVRLYTPVPGQVPVPTKRYEYRAGRTIDFVSSRNPFVLSSPTRTTPTAYPVSWNQFYRYLHPAVQWWVPRNACSPYVEVRSSRFNYFYCDRVLQQDEQVVASGSVEKYFDQPAVSYHWIAPDALAALSSKCPSLTWNGGNTMLIAMNDQTGEEVVFYHRW